MKPIAKTMSNGELFRFAWVAVRQALENIQKWDRPAHETVIEQLRDQEKELKTLMEESFTAALLPKETN